jgi:signal peptidase I
LATCCASKFGLIEGRLLSKSSVRRVWENDYFQTAVMILVILGLVFGFWYGSRLVLNTEYPMLAVASGSMVLPPPGQYGVRDDGWSQPFGRTLHTGDLIIVQGVKPEDVYAAPYNASGRSGDILVFFVGDQLIVHRAVEKIVDLNGNISFKTQGDNNPGPGPGSPTPSESVIGRVVMRIPWFGHIALYMRNSTGIVIVVVLIVVLIVVEFLLPLVTRKKPEDNVDEHVEQNPETENPF